MKTLTLSQATYGLPLNFTNGRAKLTLDGLAMRTFHETPPFISSISENNCDQYLSECALLNIGN